MKVEIVSVGDLQPGDIVRLTFRDGSADAYSDATVYRANPTEDFVKLYRPFVHTGDVAYTGNEVSKYVGIEDFSIQKSQTITRLRRGGALR